MHLHLDLVGGLSGDMFIGAMLDCFPDRFSPMCEQLALAGFDQLVDLSFESFNDGVLSGSKFDVTPKAVEPHHHRHYQDIKQRIENSRLDEKTRDISLAIFKIIADAEALIHDKPVETIAFHEVGAWDSIADVICASYLIGNCNITSASASDIPLGSGQVKTAHGMLPVPAPATTQILKGFKFVDDGISGERVTPTGAAILKYLAPAGKPPGILAAQGFGFGTKRFPGISNVVRLLVLAESTSNTYAELDETLEQVEQVEFELDDQTPEQIATALDQLRVSAGVIDIVQYAVVGKKNRLAHTVRILCETAKLSETTDLVFSLTSTLGIRHAKMNRRTLAREAREIQHQGRTYRVKLADRPGGTTAKAEMDDLTDAPSLEAQHQIRAVVEREAKDQT